MGKIDTEKASPKNDTVWLYLKYHPPLTISVEYEAPAGSCQPASHSAPTEWVSLVLSCHSPEKSMIWVFASFTC